MEAIFSGNDANRSVIQEQQHTSSLHKISRAKWQESAILPKLSSSSTSTILTPMFTGQKSPREGFHMLCSSYSSGFGEVSQDEQVNVEEVVEPSIAMPVPVEGEGKSEGGTLTLPEPNNLVTQSWCTL